MALSVKVRHGHSVQIGDTLVTVHHARRGETQLLIAAPPSVPITILKKKSES